jgi:hypothetical protein
LRRGAAATQQIWQVGHDKTGRRHEFPIDEYCALDAERDLQPTAGFEASTHGIELFIADRFAVGPQISRADVCGLQRSDPGRDCGSDCRCSKRVCADHDDPF